MHYKVLHALVSHCDDPKLSIPCATAVSMLFCIFCWHILVDYACSPICLIDAYKILFSMNNKACSVCCWCAWCAKNNDSKNADTTVELSCQSNRALSILATSSTECLLLLAASVCSSSSRLIRRGIRSNGSRAFKVAFLTFSAFGRKKGLEHAV